ncbi:MAG TPA: lipocalin family protein [Planctomycetota bacterium]|nr:lipocalin family protein [Planctomycetota bacterium]
MGTWSRILTLGLLTAAGCAAPPAATWAFDPAAEEGVHGDVRVEWWYHWGFLEDDAGGRWTVFSSFFRSLRPGQPPTRYQLYDLTNLATGERSSRSAVGAELLPLVKALTGDTKLPRPHLLIPGEPLEKAGDPLQVRYGDDLFERSAPGAYRLKTGDVDLQLKAESAFMAIEGTGLTGLGNSGDMHYYSIPRLRATGTVHGRKATGSFWYDHQWGSTWTEPTVGWSWWGLQLDDGSNVNAYVLRELKTGLLLRAVCTHDARVYPLDATVETIWESPTKVRYPVAWTLKAGPLTLRIDPLFRDRESPVLGEQESIWEGPVHVTGSATGRGFQELVSYARERRKTE